MPKVRSSQRSRRRITRLVIFTTIVTTATLFFGSAIGYVLILSNPGCNLNPKPLRFLPMPEEVWLSNADGQKLRAWYYLPRNGAVILSLGSRTGSLGDTLPPVEFLLEAGYGALQIDHRNCARPASPVTMGMREVYDAEAGLAFLRTRTEVERIGVIGFSMGGVTAIRSASRNTDISAVVADGGYHNMGENIVKPGRPKSIVEKAYLYTVTGLLWALNSVNPWHVSPIDEIALISPRPIFLIYGEYEAETGFAQAQFDAAQQPKQLWLVPGSNHGINQITAPEQYRTKILDFLNENLLP